MNFNLELFSVDRLLPQLLFESSNMFLFQMCRILVTMMHLGKFLYLMYGRTSTNLLSQWTS